MATPKIWMVALLPVTLVLLTGPAWCANDDAIGSRLRPEGSLLQSNGQAAVQGKAAFDAIVSNASAGGSLVTAGDRYSRVQRVTKAIIGSIPDVRADADNWGWQVALIQDSTANAFCLPGGKIIVLDGLLSVVGTDDSALAAVIGHEVAHALLEHGRSESTREAIASSVIALLSLGAAIAAEHNGYDASQTFQLSSDAGHAIANLFVLYPFSRQQELDADRWGLELAARAGYDPYAGAAVWSRLSGGSLELLSTHPSSTTRQRALNEWADRLAGSFIANEKPEAETTREGRADLTAPDYSGAADHPQCVLSGGQAIKASLATCVRIKGAQWKEK